MSRTGPERLRLVLATANPDKASEIATMLGPFVELMAPTRAR
ncbi:MAG: hypothetical protein WKF43_06900 [Acidimicrobiales bacterium]